MTGLSAPPPQNTTVAVPLSAGGGGTNYLIVGSDKADDLTDEQRQALQTGERGGTNTDTIIVLHTGSGGRTTRRR